MQLINHLRFRETSCWIISHISCKVLWLIQVINDKSGNSFVGTSYCNKLRPSHTQRHVRCNLYRFYQSEQHWNLHSPTQNHSYFTTGGHPASLSWLRTPLGAHDKVVHVLVRRFRFYCPGATPLTLGLVWPLSWLTVFVSVNYLNNYIHNYTQRIRF